MEQTADSEVAALAAAGNVTGLIELLQSSPDAAVRQAAAEALEKLGDVSAAPGLLAALRDPVKEVRTAAAQALGPCGDDATTRELRGMLEDPDPGVQEAAIYATLNRMANTKGASTQPAESDAPKAAAPNPQKAAGTSTFTAYLICFLIGFVLWLVPLLFFILTKWWMGFMWLGLAAVVALYIIAMPGWNVTFVDKSGSRDKIYKFGIVMAISFTGIGLIVVMFWTGKSVLNWWAERH
ncbi:MAG: HEAT repeat domain-containing protein [Chloroflexi bacterium]|nr:HEAT repeat domain-containing protein [Chloroflexota bacterium]